MLHTKFRRNWPAGSGVEDFLRVFTIYGRGGHLGHVTSIMSSDFHFHNLKAFIQKLVQIGTVVSEKSNLNFCMHTTLGQGQELTHISSYIQLEVCSYYLSGHLLQ